MSRSVVYLLTLASTAAETTPHDHEKFNDLRKQHYNMAEQLRRARELLAQEDDDE